MGLRKITYDIERLVYMLVREELRVENVPNDTPFVDDIRDPSGDNSHGFRYAEGPADGPVHVAGK